MTDSNLTQITKVKESTWGTTPGSPTTKKVRITGEGLGFGIGFTESAELRSDRQTTDLIQTDANAAGPLNIELSFREYDDFLEGAFFSTWVTTPTKDNDGTADSELTGVTNSTDTYAVDADGTDFIANMMVVASGFTNAANNAAFEVASSTGTTVVMAGTPTLVDETAPPGTARLTQCGLVGASGDIGATSTTITSSALDFTTMNISAYTWLKVGGTAAGDQFATAANNGWVRVTAVAANTLTVDNVPTGFTTDAGTSKTIKLWFGDYIRNGIVRNSWTLEKGFLGQTTPNYISYRGQMAENLDLNIGPGAPINGVINFRGKDAVAPTTSPLDATPLETETADVMNGVADVARISEGGSTVAGPNYVNNWTISIQNNLRDQRGVGVLGLIGVGLGKLSVTGTLQTYFGDAAMYTKFINNTDTSVSAVVNKDNQAYVFSLPRVKFQEGNPLAGGSDQDVLLEMRYSALRDSSTDTMVQLDRIAYYE